MSNKIKETYQGFIDWDEISLEDLKEEIEKLQKEGFTDVNIFAENEYVYYSVSKLREENQEEKENREKSELAQKELIRLEEIKKYNAIKEKYNL